MITAKEAKQGTKFKYTVKEASKRYLTQQIEKAMENGETKTKVQVKELNDLDQWVMDPIIRLLTEHGYTTWYNPEEYSNYIIVDWSHAN